MTRPDVRRLTALAVLTICVVSSARVGAQPVTLSDERVVFKGSLGPMNPGQAADLMDVNTGPVELSPDGQTLLYVDQPAPRDGRRPVQLVILRLASLADGAQRTEFKPDVGQPTLNELLWRFSPDGKLLVVPHYAGPAPSGGVKPRPVSVCQLATGRVARTGFSADLRYADVDHTGKLLLYIDGESFSLETGKPARRFGYGGLVRSACPTAPLVCTDTGMEGRPGPWRVHVWNLRDDERFAPLPHNENFKYSTYTQPQWTRDGGYVFFGDFNGDHFTYKLEDRDKEESQNVTRIWNAKTNQLLEKQLPSSNWRKAGPGPGTMIMKVGKDQALHYAIFDAESGASADIPLAFEAFRSVGGDRIAYVKLVDGEPRVCVAKLNWDVPRPAGGNPQPATKPTRAKIRPINSR